MHHRADLSTLLQLVREHDRLKRHSISLVPTENILSPLAEAVLSSDLVNRYYLLDNTVWEYPQTELIAGVSDLAIQALAELYNASSVNIRPLSGLNCMTVVLAALTAPGDVLYSISPKLGGHGATQVVARRLGLRCHYLPLRPADLTVDIAACLQTFAEIPPSFIYLDHSNVLRPLALDGLREVVPPTTFIYYDCSHLMGLMMDRSYFDPRNHGIPVIGGSVHKTFPGPQKGVLMTSDLEIAARLENTTDSFVSSHHVNSVAALAVTALEMLEFGAEYSRRLQANARRLGDALAEEGMPVQRLGGVVSKSHQVWIDVSELYESPHHAVGQLKDCRIVVNCARIPSLGGEKGLRLGATEVTRLGMGPDEMSQIARLVSDSLLRLRPNAAVVRDVEEIRSAFITPQFCFSSEEELLSHAAG